MTSLSGPSAPQPRGRGFWVMRDLPTLLWLTLLVIATVTHRELPAAGWLMLHLLFLGAITHAILVWSQHFSFALTRSRQSTRDRTQQNARLLAANGGIALVLVGVPLAVWPLTVAGAALLSGAVVWHGIDLWRRLRGALPGQFTKSLRYYVASAAFLPFGAGLGAWIAGPDSPGGGVVLAHAITNVLGWMGLTIAGTVVTLWPTMLRTRAAASAARDAARALPVLAGSVVVAALGAALGLVPVATLGLAGYAAGLVLIGVALFAEARGAAPKSFSTLSVGAGLLWWLGLIVVLVIAGAQAWVGDLAAAGAGTNVGSGSAAAASGISALRVAISWAAPFLAAGFAAQVLLGALSYLVPVVLGGGPSAVRAATATFDAGGSLRVATANAALFVCALPVTSLMRVAVSMLYLIAMASFLPLFLVALRRQKAAKREAAAAFATRREAGAGVAAAAEAAEAAAAAEPAGAAGAAGAAAGLSANQTGLAPIPPLSARPSVNPEGTQPVGRRSGQALLGLAAVILATALAGAADPHALASLTRQAPAIGGSATGSTAGNASVTPEQTVQVTAANMRFSPSTIEVPRGTRLIIELTNTDTEQPHDLVFENGTGGERLAPGESTTIDVGVITDDLEGWCSIIGHRQMGMTLDIIATGDSGVSEAGSGAVDPGSTHAGGSSTAGSNSTAGSSTTGAAGLIDLMEGDLGRNFAPYDAALPPLPPSDGPSTHKITLPVSELTLPVAPGTQGPVLQQLWTFGGTAPGPILHGRVGDTFEITLVNDGTIGHSIDFHAGALAPDRPMRTIAPGEELSYTFTATRSGIWMYHCSTMPMSAHIANGMFGAVIIEPDDLPPVDQSYVLVQSEYYLGGTGAGAASAKATAEGAESSGSESAPGAGPGEVDVDKIAAERPDLVVFNGVANQYARSPLTAQVGERVRVWLLDAGPNRASSFHVIGGQFDTVWSEGRFLINRATDTGSQALALQPAQGGYVELVFPEAGNYPFVSHFMVDAERGASGVFRVRE